VVHLPLPIRGDERCGVELEDDGWPGDTMPGEEFLPLVEPGRLRRQPRRGLEPDILHADLRWRSILASPREFLEHGLGRRGNGAQAEIHELDRLGRARTN